MNFFFIICSLLKSRNIKIILGKRKKKIFKNKKMDETSAIFKSIMNNNNIPILDIGRRKGATDYIDFINYQEVNQPVMKGTDIYGRDFIVLKFVIDNICGMQTFFQRYSDSYNLWMGCGPGDEILMNTIGGIKQIQAELIRNIINNGISIITEEHQPNHLYEFKGKKVILYDKKKWNAAIIIQKAFKLCRYNPNYEMCHKIQIKYHQTIIKERNRNTYINSVN